RLRSQRHQPVRSGPEQRPPERQGARRADPGARGRTVRERGAPTPSMNLNNLIERVRGYDSSADTELLRRAYDFSAAVHKGQKRKSGEPYLVHPVAVAGIITELKLDVPSVATALLHDTVEDTLTTLAEIHSSFGGEIAELVDGVTKISQ